MSVLSVERPNIVIILTDDLGWGDVSYNGGPIATPNIDRFSEIGVQMNRFIVLQLAVLLELPFLLVLIVFKME